MKRKALTSAIVRAALVVAAASVPVALGLAAGQFRVPEPPGVPTGPAPRMADGRPDLSGVWWPGTDVPLRPLGATPPARGRGPASPRPRPVTFASLYQPWAKEKAKTLGDKDDPGLRCIPVAFGTLNISLLGNGFVGQIVQTPTSVIMLTETYHSFRIVPTDGRKHRDDVAPSFRGDSIGHWEGETLVVETRNFSDNTWMQAEGIVSFHSDALHIVERYRRVDMGHLQIDAVVEDPKVLTGPWTVPTQTLVLAPFDQIMEVGCSGTETYALMEAAAKQNYGKK
jgi:hypothetical protein